MSPLLSACRLTTLLVMTSLVAMASNPYYRRPQETTRTLYTADDHLLQLGGADLVQTISATDNAWIVEFYATWCGHCQRVAPAWRQYASNIRGWSPILRVATVACSDPSNAEICRRYHVRGYPTIKFFPPHAGPTFLGDQYYGAKTATGLQDGTLNYIDRLRREGRTTASWPILHVLRSSVEVLESLSRQTLHMYLLVEGGGQTNMEANKMVILDLAERYPDVAVLRVTRVHGRPAGTDTLYRLQWGGDTHALSSERSRGGLRAAILRDLAEQEPGAPPPTAASTVTPATTTVTYTFSPASGLHMQDIESALYYSLWVEVGGQHNIIRGHALRALKTYISVLARYHPGEAHIMRFLNHTDRWLQQQQGALPGEQWVQGITRLQTDAAYVPDRLRWTGCQGSQPRFRGYPCALWMTFHSLTLGAFTGGRADAEFSPLEVLQAVRGYVQHFLGCSDCAAHFGNMSATMEQDMTGRRKDGVMWLWRAHNRVNNRLHGDTTEDPQHPKIQFPSEQACPQCRRRTPSGLYDNETQWNEHDVFRFLLDYYRQRHVIDDDLPYEFEEGIPTAPPDGHGGHEGHWEREGWVDATGRAAGAPTGTAGIVLGAVWVMVWR